jgi:uridine kinase
LVVEEIRRRLEGRDRPLVVAVDGRAGTGKSTLAAELRAFVDITLIEGDDFYAGGTATEWDVMTPAEKAAHCIDWRRLRAEALEPLLEGRTATWQPWDWAADRNANGEPVQRNPAPVIVIEGVYSARPELSDLIDLTVLVDVPSAERHKQLVGREGGLDEWHLRWAEAERYYFTEVQPASTFDLVVGADDAGDLV